MMCAATGFSLKPRVLVHGQLHQLMCVFLDAYVSFLNTPFLAIRALEFLFTSVEVLQEQTCVVSY